MRLAALVALSALAAPSASLAQAPPEPDGDDDPTPASTGAFPARARWERVGRSRAALRRVCDLTALGGSLYAAHAYTPLDSDGATITRYTPGAREPFSVAFDWSRPGQPRAGGGGGQGFLRVHAIGGRLFVPDADPPYAGLGLVDPGAEGYVFVSDPGGRFAPPRGERLRPPGPPDASGRPGAGVVPRAYHVIDVVRWRGMTLASTGSVPPRARAWRGPSPGALHVADARLARWTYAADYPRPYRDGVWRMTFMTRFRGRLYAGLQDYDGREPNDYVVVEPPAAGASLTQADLSPRRVTSAGGALTLRWYVDGGTLYWIAIDRDRRVRLRATDDGDRWRVVDLPVEAGPPTDVLRWRGALVVLTAGGLYRLRPDGAPALVASPPTYRSRGRGLSHFETDDAFCASPLGVLGDDLYAGSQRDGSLWRLAPVTVDGA